MRFIYMTQQLLHLPALVPWLLNGSLFHLVIFLDFTISFLTPFYFDCPHLLSRAPNGSLVVLSITHLW